MHGKRMHSLPGIDVCIFLKTKDIITEINAVATLQGNTAIREPSPVT